MDTFDHKKIEKKWKEKWKETKQYHTENVVEGKENEYVLVEFPYPSGNLHVGHWYAFGVPDIYARMRRMQGKNVLYPIGFDAFGLPAENAAIKRNLDPREWTEANMKTMTEQLESMGNSFDWSRFIRTCDPEYYKWTQWLFLQFYKKGLAYKKKSTVPWCESCKTVLANEQIIHGACERCGSVVSNKELDQWFFKITAYAERLLQDLEKLDWPEEIKQAQREWIGKSEGSLLPFDIVFGVDKKRESVEVFTTRADTLYGVSYLVLAPEHELLDTLKAHITNWEEVAVYREATKQKKELERKEGKGKTGVEVKGISAINPVNGEEVPVWIADYVLGSYGTGAVMAVPAHDERDWEFAKKYGLHVKECIVQRIGTETKAVDIARKTAYAILERNNGDILIQQLQNIGRYLLPGGGVNEEESLEDALRREIREETGYTDVAIGKKICRTQVFHENNAGKLVYREVHVFTAQLLSETNEGAVLEKEEIDQGLTNIWMSRSAARDAMQHNDRVGKMVFFEPFRRYIENDYCYTEEGVLCNSAQFSDLSSEEAKTAITTHVGGKLTTQYRLRDWLLSRQRYWGCPIPIVYDPEGTAHSVPEEHLPWLLPQDAHVKPTGKAPLATSEELKDRTEKLFGKGWTPEVDTMDTFIDSSWHFLRYLDPHNSTEFSSKEAQDAWMPVSFYSGGAEHTTMHLLYSRFFHKALFDMGLVRDSEPYTRRMNRGLILGPDGQKMSKSKGNVIDPDEHVERVGADTVKMYLAFVGPYNEVGQYPWDLGGIAGIRRFLERVWKMRLSLEERKENAKEEGETLLFLHKTIKKVREDTEALKFNTAISTLMSFVNYLEKKEKVSFFVYEKMILLLAPYAPFLMQEIWSLLGKGDFIHSHSFPEYDASFLEKENDTIAVQVNGKMRGTFTIEKNTKESVVLLKAKEMSRVKDALLGKTIKKEIYIKGKMVSIVGE
jgi:leucyl-tRNA synthetase